MIYDGFEMSIHEMYQYRTEFHSPALKDAIETLLLRKRRYEGQINHFILKERGLVTISSPGIKKVFYISFFELKKSIVFSFNGRFDG